MRDIDNMIKKLYDVWFGYYNLFASTPRFSKPKKPSPRICPMQSKVEKIVSTQNSYASIFRGVPKDKIVNETADDIIYLSSMEFIVEKRNRACFVKAKDYLTLPNLWMLCFDEVFKDFDIRYIGSFWVMFEFKNKEACKNFLATDVINHWIVDKCPWDRNFVPSERLLWVDVEGLLLCSWIKEAFRKIIAKWGNIVHLEDGLSEDVYKNRIGLMISFQGIISDVLKVSFDDQLLLVRIK